jgi:hypothetical protein
LSGRHGHKKKTYNAADRKITIPDEISREEPSSARPQSELDNRKRKDQYSMYKPPDSPLALWGVLLGAVVAFIYLMQWRAMDQAMKIDQRAWLESRDENSRDADTPERHRFAESIQSGQPVNYPLHVINSGKTPAKNITVHIFVLILPASQGPPLEWVDHTAEHPHELLESGILFPNSAARPLMSRVANNGIAIFATDDEAKAIKEGASYVAAFGVIRYDDVFKVSHTTRFCDWDTAKPGIDSAKFDTRKCAQFNDGD